MTMNNAPGGAVLDPEDDAPLLTEAFFASATLREGERLVRRGRPPVREPKQQVTIRLPPATLARLRALGPGWQNVIEQAVDEKLARMGGAGVG